ncbi:MAG: AAA family ATPase [Acidisphaera sp.]|nr:AAA family ATPase [Acidisphaera sp.]
MIYLSSLRRRPGRARDLTRFPWSLPVIGALESLELNAAVTFLVGENGSGKSTLLEGMAAGADAVSVGRHDLRRDPTLAAAREFAAGFVFVRRRHAHTRLFLRAEDVFGFTNRVMDDMAALAADEAALEAELPVGYGRMLATGAVRGQRRALAASYGENPDARSHGETFLALLGRRLAPEGLYFLDEPETPLSPVRVLALMAMLSDAVARDCQFVIATHSPILLALPQAEIVEIADGALRRTVWENLEHVRVTRAFLNDPDGVLRKLRA